MKRYVCCGTWTLGRPVHPHARGEACEALRDAGHDPEIVRALGLGPLPGFVNDLTSRREVKAYTGQ